MAHRLTGRWSRGLSMGAAQLLSAVLLVAVWGWGSRAGWLDSFSFGSPAATWAQLRAWASDGTLLNASGATLEVLGIGWLLGIAAGVALGTLIGLSRFARDVLDPYLAFFNGMPRLIIYPFLAIWLGFGLVSRVAVVLLVIVVLVSTIVASGFGEVPQELVANMRLMGAGRWQLARQVYAPSLAGWLLSSSRLTLGYAMQAAIAAEFIGASSGLGYLAVVGSEQLDVNQLWATLVVVTVLAVVLDGALARLEHRILRWRPSV